MIISDRIDLCIKCFRGNETGALKDMAHTTCLELYIFIGQAQTRNAKKQTKKNDVIAKNKCAKKAIVQLLDCEKSYKMHQSIIKALDVYLQHLVLRVIELNLVHSCRNNVM